MYISSRKGDLQKSLWEQYVAGNKSVFGELYTYYHKSLTAYCIGKVGSVANADGFRYLGKVAPASKP